MIELKFTGEGPQLVQEMLHMANVMSLGLRTEQNLLAHQTKLAEQQPAVTETPAEPVKREPKKDKLCKPKAEVKAAEPVEPAAEVKTESADDVFADENVENVESNHPTPTNLDELRALITKVIASKGPDVGRQIVLKYAPKIGLVPIEQYGKVAGWAFMALESTEPDIDKFKEVFTKALEGGA